MGKKEGNRFDPIDLMPDNCHTGPLYLAFTFEIGEGVPLLSPRVAVSNFQEAVYSRRRMTGKIEVRPYRCLSDQQARHHGER
jgi:hypothetical protein